jgi:hypothetical protein
LVSAAAILSGCGSNASSGGDDPAGSGAAASDTAPLSCEGTIDDCHSYAAMPNDERSQWCTGDGDVLVPNCSTADVIATCVYTNRLGENDVYWYQGTEEAAADMQEFCTTYGGTLTMK